MFKPYVKEIVLTVLVYAWLLFVSTNVNVTLGQTYLHFALGSLAFLIIGITIFGGKLHITFQRKPGGNFNAILWGLGGWIILLITSVIVLTFMEPTTATINAVIGLMGATTPALATSKIANLLTFGIAIAYIETQLWARAFEFFADFFRLDISKRSVKVIFSALMILIITLAFIFVLFHLTAKGITNVPALVIVFLMMIISLIMVAWFEETRQAVYLHIWANTVASYLILFAVNVL